LVFTIYPDTVTNTPNKEHTMATVFQAPIEAPPLYDFANYSAACDRYIEQIRDIVKAEFPDDEYVGEVIKFPVADGYARYMVAQTSPLELFHLALDDGYQIPKAHERGLDMDDVRAEVAHERRLREYFANKA
jgi:hypothetical protein